MRALRGLSNHRLDVVAENGRVILSLLDSPNIKQILCTEAGLRVVLRNTEIRFGDIVAAKIGFVTAGLGNITLPQTITINSLDPRVAWAQEMRPKWHRVSILKIYVSSTDTYTDIADDHSDMQPVRAVFRDGLTG